MGASNQCGSVQEWLCYHPDVVQYRVPRSHYYEPDDLLLIPTCPCCGIGRTMHIYAQQEPRLILEPSFRDWCRECREKMAEKVDNINRWR